MPKKQPHVPEMRSDPKPNREQRRHPEKLQQPEAVENAADEDLSRSRNVQESIVREGSQDQLSVRAKNSGHGKKTADKWNQ
jgi:hypothetical protein